jgi:hypothetical protein
MFIFHFLLAASYFCFFWLLDRNCRARSRVLVDELGKDAWFHELLNALLFHLREISLGIFGRTFFVCNIYSNILICIFCWRTTFTCILNTFIWNLNNISLSSSSSSFLPHLERGATLRFNWASISHRILLSL